MNSILSELELELHVWQKRTLQPHVYDYGSAIFTCIRYLLHLAKSS